MMKKKLYYNIRGRLAACGLLMAMALPNATAQVTDDNTSDEAMQLPEGMQTQEIDLSLIHI